MWMGSKMQFLFAPASLNIPTMLMCTMEMPLRAWFGAAIFNKESD